MFLCQYHSFDDYSFIAQFHIWEHDNSSFVLSQGSVQFSCSVVSNSLWPYGLQHSRPPCPLPTPRACSNSCPLSQWCHPTVLSSVIPFSSCLQSFWAPRSFPMSQFFLLCGQSIGASASASVRPMKGLISFRTDWLDLLAVQGTLKSLLQHHSSKASGLQHSAFFMAHLSHPYMTTGKTIALTRRTFVVKIMSLLFNMLPKFVIQKGNGNPLHYSCLENPVDRGAWWVAVHRVAQSWTRLKRHNSSKFVIAFLPRSKLLCSTLLWPNEVFCGSITLGLFVLVLWNVTGVFIFFFFHFTNILYFILF